VLDRHLLDGLSIDDTEFLSALQEHGRVYQMSYFFQKVFIVQNGLPRSRTRMRAHCDLCRNYHTQRDPLHIAPPLVGKADNL